MPMAVSLNLVIVASFNFRMEWKSHKRFDNHKFGPVISEKKTEMWKFTDHRRQQLQSDENTTKLGPMWQMS